MQVQSLGRQEDPLKQKMATQSNILAWKIPWTEEPYFLNLFRLRTQILEPVCFSLLFTAKLYDWANLSNRLVSGEQAVAAPTPRAGPGDTYVQSRSARLGGVRPVRRLVLQGVHVLCHFHIFSHYLKILAKPKNRLYFAQPILFICVLLSCLSSPFSVGKSLAFDSLIRGALFILPLFSFYVPWSSKPKLK